MPKSQLCPGLVDSGVMADDEQIHVWRYEAPGRAPTKVMLPRDIDPTQAGNGRWRGEASCGEREDCGSWLVDISTDSLDRSLPLICPTCEARSAYPEIVWRGVKVDCYFCGSMTTIYIINPESAWPSEMECFKCESSLRIPIDGRTKLH